MLRIFIILLALICKSGAAFGLVVTFQPSVAVDGVSITLGDIADFDEQTELSRALASQIVSQSPMLGETGRLDSAGIIRQISSVLPHTGDVLWQGSATVDVQRNSIQIGPEKIDVLINSFLDDKRHLLPEADIRFIPASLPLPFLIPTGEVEYEVIPSRPQIIESNRFTIIAKVDGRVRKNMSIRGKLEILAPVAVANTSLKKGTLLIKEHLSMATMDISALKSPCLDIHEIVGKKITRSVKEGKAISLSQVEFPPLVQRGQLVRMVFQKDALLLTATGVARSDGIQNQTIRVQNISSNKIVYCRVAAPGVVEVAL